jgi:hypothetical protein
MCDLHDVITEPDMCVYVNDTKNKLHLLKPCTDSSKSFCNYSLAAYDSPVYCTASTETVNLTLPGEYCSLNSQCYSGICSSGVCQGAAYNQTCADDRDCAAGLYCFNQTLTCMYQQEFGAVILRSNFDLFVLELYKRQ